MPTSHFPLIPDSNIFLSFFLDEKPEKKWAEDLFDEVVSKRIGFFVPSIWHYEICNRLSRLDDHLQEKSFLLFGRFRKICQVAELDDELVKRALEIINRFSKIAFYDAVYHALAILNDGTFVTLDQKYYEKTKTLKHIKLLKDY